MEGLLRSGCASAEAQAFLMGCAFLLAFAAYDTIQVFAKRLYPGDLGTNMTMAIYAAFTLSQLFAPAVVNILGPRLSMGLGICGYASVVVAGLAFFETGQSAALVMLSGCVLGVGAGLLWTGQGQLILDYSTSANRGRLFSIFWALYRMASVIGGLLSYFYFSVSDTGSGSTGLYFIFLALVLAGALAVVMLKDPADIPSMGNELASTNTDGGRDHVGISSWRTELAETFRSFQSPPMLLLSLMFWTSGGNEPFILSGFTDRWFEKRTTGMEMVWYFSCSILGVFVSGKMLDSYAKRGRERFGACVVLVLSSIVHLGGFACAGIVELNTRWHRRYELHEELVMLPSVAFVLWGLSDAMINSFLYWMIGILATSSSERARAVGFFKLLNSAAHIVGYGILPTHRVSACAQLSYNVIAYIVGAIMASAVVSRMCANKVPALLPGDAG